MRWSRGGGGCKGTTSSVSLRLPPSPEGKAFGDRVGGIMMVCKWAKLDTQARSWRFYCPACGGCVYWPQPTRGKRARICPYKRCPWCGAEMDGVMEDMEVDR